MDRDFYKGLLDRLYDGVYFVDRDRNITYWNKGAERITGYAAPEVLGKHCRNNILVHVDEKGCDVCKGSCPVAESLEDGGPREAELYLLHKSGHRVPVRVRVAPIVDPDGTVVGAVEIFSDISPGSANDRLVAELREMALLDPLTELGNRRYMEMHLDSKIDEMARYGWRFGLLFIDIDRFKEINDTHGHDVGDKALKMVARTLANGVRGSDLVGRWGGEEFVLLIVNVGGAQLARVAEKLRFLVERSRFEEGGVPMGVTVSIGGSLARRDDTPETLLKRADRLMYRSKEAGRNRVTCASDDRRSRSAAGGSRRGPS